MDADPIIYLVSETADGPTLPFDAWAALSQVRAQAWLAAQLDDAGVPQDSPLRAKAYRLLEEFVVHVAAQDLERIKVEHGREQWRARKRRPVKR